MALETDEFDDVDHCIKLPTKARLQAIEKCLPVPIHFLGLTKQAFDHKMLGLGLLDGYPDFPHLDRRIKTMDLYNLFKNWSMMAGEKKPLSQRNFNHAIDGRIKKVKNKGTRYFCVETIDVRIMWMWMMWMMWI